jgi:hypothetical protein
LRLDVAVKEAPGASVPASFARSGVCGTHGSSTVPWCIVNESRISPRLTAVAPALVSVTETRPAFRPPPVSSTSNEEGA